MFGGTHIREYICQGAIGAALATTSATTIYTITIAQRCRPVAAFWWVTTQCTVTPAVINFTSTSGGTTGDCGKLTIPIATTASHGIYEKTDYNISGTNAAGTTVRWVTTLRRGDRVVVTVDTASTAGAGIGALLVEEDPDVFENETLFTKTSN